MTQHGTKQQDEISHEENEMLKIASKTLTLTIQESGIQFSHLFYLILERRNYLNTNRKIEFYVLKILKDAKKLN